MQFVASAVGSIEITALAHSVTTFSRLLYWQLCVVQYSTVNFDLAAQIISSCLVDHAYPYQKTTLRLEHYIFPRRAYRTNFTKYQFTSASRYSITPNSAKINPLNAELNPIRHLLALLGAQHILHVSRIRVKNVWFIPPHRHTPSCRILS